MTVMQLQWNKNGNWLLTASRDHLIKLFDIRNMKEEVQTFKGHKKEATGEWILCVMMLDNLLKHFLTFSAFSVEEWCPLINWKMAILLVLVW